MARYTELLNAGGFATGTTRYDDFHPGEEQTARIVLTVVLESRLTVQVILDTGAPWCVLDPQLGERLGITEYAAGFAPNSQLMIRGARYAGRLHRVRIGLLADYGGQDLEVEATVFVPILQVGETWRHPNFIGLDGFLNRIRFAIDPKENAFYFGPI